MGVCVLFTRFRRVHRRLLQTHTYSVYSFLTTHMQVQIHLTRYTCPLPPPLLSSPYTILPACLSIPLFLPLLMPFFLLPPDCPLIPFPFPLLQSHSLFLSPNPLSPPLPQSCSHLTFLLLFFLFLLTLAIYYSFSLRPFSYSSFIACPATYHFSLLHPFIPLHSPFPFHYVFSSLIHFIPYFAHTYSPFYLSHSLPFPFSPPLLSSPLPPTPQPGR